MLPIPAQTRGSGKSSNRLALYVALAVFAAHFAADLQVGDLFDGEAVMAFMVPTQPAEQVASHALDRGHTMHSSTHGASPSFGHKEATSSPSSGRGRVAMPAAASASIGVRVLNAMGAGAVASIIQAALSAVFEPIVNRVLVKRMKIMEACRDVTPSQMLNFFKTTLATNFLKFPFFEAINAFCACFPFSGLVRGIFTGFVFTTATLPITNFRYRKSMDLPVNWGNIYEAYLPTVIRDIVYGIARNYCTIAVLRWQTGWTIASPQTLFIVVILGCLISAPFNEWRGYLLQSKGQELTFKEFFKPSNFLRSTSLGALKQGLALAVGYWAAPPATKLVNSLLTAFRG